MNTHLYYLYCYSITKPTLKCLTRSRLLPIGNLQHMLLNSFLIEIWQRKRFQQFCRNTQITMGRMQKRNPPVNQRLRVVVNSPLHEQSSTLRQQYYLHYALRSSLTKDEVALIIQDFFGDLDVNDPIYKTVHDRLYSCMRSWQNRWVNVRLLAS